MLPILIYESIEGGKGAGKLMKIQYKRFPGGLSKAITFSFDDGRSQDRRLVELLNRYGLRSTFHLNSGLLGKENYIRTDEVAALYAGHEVSVHTVTHPFLELSPTDQVTREIYEDRKALERLVGYPVRGMSYPYGRYDDRIVGLLPALGIEYARTIQSHGRFDFPPDPLRWHPTCHHKRMVEMASTFLTEQDNHSRMALLYVWGHSYEFDADDNWELIDRIGEKLQGELQVWRATNAEIIAYKKALDRLRFSADAMIVHNPSAIDVWIDVDGVSVCIRSGETLQL